MKEEERIGCSAKYDVGYLSCRLFPNGDTGDTTDDDDDEDDDEIGRLLPVMG